MKTALDSRQGGPRRFPVPVEGATAASVPMTGAIVPKRVTNLHLVREHDRRRARDLSAVALVLAPLALVLLVFAWENVEVIRRGYELRKIEAARDRLAEENRRLRARLASGASLSDAERRAREEMGFVSPRPDQVIHLQAPTGTATQAPQPPAGGAR